MDDTLEKTKIDLNLKHKGSRALGKTTNEESPQNNKSKSKKGGRPPKNKSDRKTKPVFTYLSEQEKRDYDKFCEKVLKIDKSAHIRKLIQEALEKARKNGQI